MKTYMGIDLGTSSVKALVCDENGNVLKIAQREYDVLTPQIGYAEQKPEDWWTSTLAVIKEALGANRSASNTLSGIGLSGQMHGLVALDEDYQPVCNAIIHLDQRSKDERAEIVHTANDLIDSELLNIPSTGMLLCSLLWLKQNRPIIYDKIRYVMSPKDYIRFLLTGKLGTDRSDASATLAYSIKSQTWCYDLIDRLGIKRNIWLTVHSSTEVCGPITKEVQRELGINAWIPVVYGAGDCLAAAVGNNIVSENDMVCNIGTASQMGIIVNKPIVDKERKCQVWCSSVDGSWIFQGGSLNGGNALKWLRNRVLDGRQSYNNLDSIAEKIPVGSEGVIFLPYLAGERSPYNNPDAKGVYFGLSLKHSNANLIRATMEGITFNLNIIKKTFTQMDYEPRRVISSGGAARSKLWRQIQADIFNLPIYTTNSIEEAAFGAAIMASVGTGDNASVHDACEKMVKLCDSVTAPREENVIAYQELQEEFNNLYHRIFDGGEI